MSWSFLCRGEVVAARLSSPLLCVQALPSLGRTFGKRLTLTMMGTCHWKSSKRSFVVTLSCISTLLRSSLPQTRRLLMSKPFYIRAGPSVFLVRRQRLQTAAWLAQPCLHALSRWHWKQTKGRPGLGVTVQGSAHLRKACAGSLCCTFACRCEATTRERDKTQTELTQTIATNLHFRSANNTGYLSGALIWHENESSLTKPHIRVGRGPEGNQ